jgi:hypothetical protein
VFPYHLSALCWLGAILNLLPPALRVPSALVARRQLSEPATPSQNSDPSPIYKGVSFIFAFFYAAGQYLLCFESMRAATTASAVHIDAVFSTAHGLPTVDRETSFLGHHVLGLVYSRIKETFVSEDGIRTFKFCLRDVNQAASTIDVYCHGAWADALSFVEPGDQAIIIGSRVELRTGTQHLFQMVVHEESVSQPDVMVALNGNRKFLFHISKHNLLTHRAPGQHARRLSKLDNTLPIIPSSFHGEDVPYTTLAAAVAAGSSSALINIWAVVGEFSPPRPTKGTDTIVLLTLIDATTSQPVRASLFIKVNAACYHLRVCLNLSAGCFEMPSSRGCR